MPKSRGRRKKAGNQRRAVKAKSPVFRMLQPPTDPQFREDMLAGASKVLERLPDKFASLQQLFRDHDPKNLIAAIAFYGLQRSIKVDGSTHPREYSLEQHHVELLQAVLLTLPFNEWGVAPSMPRAVQQILDELPNVSMGFLAQRIVDGKEIDDVQARTIAGLQERIRFHTHAVRNWGYFGDVITIAREIYIPLDEAFLAHHGFAATDVIEIGRVMVAELERRTRVHTDALRQVVAAKSLAGMIQRYYDCFPGLEGSPDKLGSLFPEELPLESAMGMLMAHADLRLAEIFTFDAASLSALSGLEICRIEKLLSSLSLKPNALFEQKIEFFYLSNPIWVTPLIDLGSEFLAPMPQAIMSHIHAILRRLADEAKIISKLDRARKDYLESKLTNALRSALPNADVRSGVTWSMGHQRFENDAIAIIDKVLLIAEAKAHHLTPKGLRGAPDRIKRHIQELVVDPSLQSARLEGVFWEARAGSVDARAALTEIGIESVDQIEHVIRLSVSLDDLSVLSSADSELREAGWVPAEHELAPMMNIADLIAVADILHQPILFLHYLSERGHFQRSFELIGDELDFLGLYLNSGFNLGPPLPDVRLSPSGMSAPIDHYYDARDAGLSVAKPQPNLTRYFRSIIERLAEKRPPAWTIVGIHLLCAAQYDEQLRLFRMMEKARKGVRRGLAPLKNGAVIEVKPPVNRKAKVAFYIHNKSDKIALRTAVENVASNALDEDSAEECVVFARHIDQWDTPYQIACLAKKESSPSHNG